MTEAPSPEPKKTCFIISPIGKTGSPEYIHYNRVRKYFIDTVAKDKGYNTIRSDDIGEPGKITSQIIDHLRESDLVIADLSDNNVNVFYELAIRDAVKKPVILIKGSDFEDPFDVRDLRYLRYSLDIAEIEIDKKSLAGYIDATEVPGYVPTSPVTLALIKPGDEIPANIHDMFSLILNKLSALPSVSTRRGAARSSSRGLDFQLRNLGIDVINRNPDSLRQFEGVSGVAKDYFSFMQIVQVNILKGITLVNYDPAFEIYWLWEYGKDSIWYYYDESLDHLSIGPTTYITPSRDR